MHFAVGMGCGGAIGAVGCLTVRRGWRWLGGMMTAGGVWALVPDMPRLFREDFPSLPFAAILGDKGLERALHGWGDVFFMHRSLDAQPHEYALAGFAVIVLFYNLVILQLMWLAGRRRRRVLGRMKRKKRLGQVRGKDFDKQAVISGRHGSHLSRIAEV